MAGCAVTRHVQVLQPERNSAQERRARRPGVCAVVEVSTGAGFVAHDCAYPKAVRGPRQHAVVGVHAYTRMGGQLRLPIPRGASACCAPVRVLKQAARKYDDNLVSLSGRAHPRHVVALSTCGIDLFNALALSRCRGAATPGHTFASCFVLSICSHYRAKSARHVRSWRDDGCAA